MTDLIHVMSNLVGQDGKIKISGIYDSVAPVTEEELKIYKTIDFDVVSGPLPACLVIE